SRFKKAQFARKIYRTMYEIVPRSVAPSTNLTLIQELVSALFLARLLPRHEENRWVIRGSSPTRQTHGKNMEMASMVFPWSGAFTEQCGLTWSVPLRDHCPASLSGRGDFFQRMRLNVHATGFGFLAGRRSGVY
ncbi:MAG TPA: hypothetical protein VFU31_16085, partial [Candidatus Binatia bacterium]|nr:hypothetical protein [Candidatus Binatia bacterium]